MSTLQLLLELYCYWTSPPSPACCSVLSQKRLPLCLLHRRARGSLVPIKRRSWSRERGIQRTGGWPSLYLWRSQTQTPQIKCLWSMWLHSDLVSPCELWFHPWDRYSSKEVSKDAKEKCSESKKHLMVVWSSWPVHLLKQLKMQITSKLLVRVLITESNDAKANTGTRITDQLLFLFPCTFVPLLVRLNKTCFLMPVWFSDLAYQLHQIQLILCATLL